MSRAFMSTLRQIHENIDGHNVVEDARFNTETLKDFIYHLLVKQVRQNIIDVLINPVPSMGTFFAHHVIEITLIFIR